MTADRRTTEAIGRAIRIARRIAKKDDLGVREEIESFAGNVDFADRKSLAIEENAWEHVCRTDIEPRLVFAHPAVLKANPRASIHYRGIALLSRKRVAAIAGTIDRWEDGSPNARVTQDKAMRVCRLYNAVISSIILDATDWTIENGYRHVLATIGITEDGAVRNLIGQTGERDIKERLLDWVREHDLLAEGADGGDAATEFKLVGGVCMTFGSEPDIGFRRNGELAAIVEVKAGTDPAGALERLGAIKKTFDEAPVACRNFLVAGIVTPTMRKRLAEMRMESDFDIHALLTDRAAWADFMNELFHHALRIAPEVPIPESPE